MAVDILASVRFLEYVVETLINTLLPIISPPLTGEVRLLVDRIGPSTTVKRFTTTKCL
jgi:hypothetical protein